MFIKLRIQITFTVIQTFCIIVYNKKHKERHLKLKKKLLLVCLHSNLLL
jgi:hypothetical protein